MPRLPSFPARIAALLLVLGVVAAWAHARQRARGERRDWVRPVDVLVYVLGDASPGEVDALGRTLGRLARRLGEDAAVHGVGPEPLRFDVVGPLEPARLPPSDPPRSAAGRLGHALALWRAERAVREVAPEPDARAYDVRIYLVVAGDSGGGFAEGIGAAGGEVGVVRASLGRDDVLAATAVAHEALHTLGATDKYDPAGHARVPAGLYEPERAPRFPQARAEIMVGELPLAPGRGRLPTSPEELGVGPETARELGWIAGGG